MTDYLEMLNPPQREAVESTEGPLLILAGAGSGKTRVLTCRIAYLIEHMGVAPWNILAITFTNKAAGEMRERVDRAVGARAASVWVATFHSTCCRILRRYIDRLGYDRSFSIYDTDDSRQVMKEVIKQMELDPRMYKERTLLARVSAQKNEMRTPKMCSSSARTWQDERFAEIYGAYQKRLRSNNALDFDDLLVKTVELFRDAPDVLESYQQRFRYILIDEYQDTNTVQFEFVRLLAEQGRNICVVGDDDQSIYKFRGANIRNILSFEEEFPGAAVIKLEQNYRSTGSILAAANAVIANNTGRKAKTLWTDQGDGDRVRFRHYPTAHEEAGSVIGEITDLVRTAGKKYSDFAVLYRTNAQSRLFEEKCVAADVPYQIVGGVQFYARREIKDILAYLKTVANAQDDLSTIRIINVPRRGIGGTTIARAAGYAGENDISLYDALEECHSIPGIGRAEAAVRRFTDLIGSFRSAADSGEGLSSLIETILRKTGYLSELEAENTDEARARIENLDELISKARDYEDTAEEPSLDDFLQQVSLVADIDSVEDDADRVLLMTMHAAKGLEFDTVYLTGMEENTFPGYMSVQSDDPTEIEEERRLCYVGMTRARRHLTLTAAEARMIRGETRFYKASRFISEIPSGMLEIEHLTTDTRRFMSVGGTDAGPSRVDTAAKASAILKKKNPAFAAREFRVTKADHLDYGVGDRVMHKKFGPGVVIKIEDGSRDHEVTVDFERAGIKRMFASFAKLEKIRE